MKYIINIFVIKIFLNYFMIVIGFYEESYGIVGNMMYDLVFNEMFYIGLKDFLDLKWWNGEFVWIMN